MRARTAMLGACLLAAAAACSLTTSLSGLSTGDAADGGGVSPEAGDAAASPGDAAVDGTTPEAGASTYRATVLADSPLAYYRFDDKGTVAKDETGAHDGTYKGAVAHTNGALAGEPGAAAVFDGASWVEVGDVLPFTGNAPFTIEAWASPVAGATDPGCLAAKSFAPGGAAGGLSEGYTLYIESTTNVLRFARYRNSADTGPTGPALTNGRFTHVVATYDGTNGALFVDGARVDSATSTSQLVNAANPLTIGAGRGGAYCFFHGALDEVAIYGVALPIERIHAHYAAAAAK